MMEKFSRDEICAILCDGCRLKLDGGGGSALSGGVFKRRGSFLFGGQVAT